MKSVACQPPFVLSKRFSNYTRVCVWQSSTTKSLGDVRSISTISLFSKHRVRRTVSDTLIDYVIFTGLTIRYMSAALWRPPKPEVTFVANCPFIVAILSNTEDVLFLGRLSKPWASRNIVFTVFKNYSISNFRLYIYIYVRVKLTSIIKIKLKSFCI